MSKRTKIVCTIGPASSAKATLKDMIESGMDVARINFSHGDYDSNLQLLENVRAAAKEVGRPVAILQDLQGPKIRVGNLPEEGMTLVDGNVVTLRAGTENSEAGVIPVPYEKLAKDVKKGDQLLLDDGTKELEVLDVMGSDIKARVTLGGNLISHKGINAPSASLSVDAMTEKDHEDLQFGLKQDIDFVALSFVRRAEDVEILRKEIEANTPEGVEPPQIIVKIEKHEALDNFEEILKATDAVMVARGDLGLETPATTVPLHQKDLIAQCLIAGKPVIVATQMLDSMQQMPRPTRAEVSDVANAVIDHTDCLMLSGESAMGQYPVRAVETMAQIAQETEESPLDDLIPEKTNRGEPIPFALGAAAVQLARHVQAKAVLVTTHSGFSARAIARFRPEVPIYAATDRARTRQQLVLSWGIEPVDVDNYNHPEEMLRAALEKLVADKKIAAGDKLVVVSGLKREEKFDSSVRVIEA